MEDRWLRQRPIFFRMGVGMAGILRNGPMTKLIMHIAVPLSIITETGTANAGSGGRIEPHRTWASRSWADGRRFSQIGSFGNRLRNESGSWGFGLSNSLMG